MPASEYVPPFGAAAPRPAGGPLIAALISWLGTFLLFEDRVALAVGFLPAGSVVKNLSASAGKTGDLGLIPQLGRSPGRGNGNPLQYSCLEHPMDRRAWWATVHEVAKSWTQLSNLNNNSSTWSTGIQRTVDSLPPTPSL